MKFHIEIKYEDLTDKNFELAVTSNFSDDSAKLVSEVLELFYEKWVEAKNKARYVKASANPK